MLIMVKHLERYLSAEWDLYSEIYKPIMLDIIRVQAPDCYRCKYGKNCETCQAECFEDAEKLLSNTVTKHVHL